jgi:hypothetical protein
MAELLGLAPRDSGRKIIKIVAIVLIGGLAGKFFHQRGAQSCAGRSALPSARLKALSRNCLWHVCRYG